MMQADLFFKGSDVPGIPEEINFVECFRPLAHTEFLVLASFSGSLKIKVQGGILNQEKVKKPTSLFALVKLSK